VHAQCAPALASSLNLRLLEIRRLAQWLPDMHQDARFTVFSLPFEDLDLVDEHVPELRFMLDEEVCEALNIWGPYNQY
jgi:hypothetical protein